MRIRDDLQDRWDIPTIQQLNPARSSFGMEVSTAQGVGYLHQKFGCIMHQTLPIPNAMEPMLETSINIHECFPHPSNRDAMPIDTGEELRHTHSTTMQCWNMYVYEFNET